eukprot:scaffold8501_cov165-Amphora_coffeaeformis.AAC.6
MMKWRKNTSRWCRRKDNTYVVIAEQLDERGNFRRKNVDSVRNIGNKACKQTVQKRREEWTEDVVPAESMGWDEDELVGAQGKLPVASGLSKVRVMP